MTITGCIPQLRTTDLAASIDFYTQVLGFEVVFVHQDFYAGLRVGNQLLHLKQVDAPDPSIAFVEAGDHLHLYFTANDVAGMAAQLAAKGVPLLRDAQRTAWNTRELVLRDDQGHTLYIGEPLAPDGASD